MNPEDALRKVPAEVKKLEVEIWEKKLALEKAKFRLKNVELDVITLVAKVKDEAGKLVNTNEALREQAMRRYLEADKDNDAAREVASLRRLLADEEPVLQRMLAHLSYLDAIQKNARVLLLSRSPGTLVFDEALP